MSGMSTSIGKKVYLPKEAYFCPYQNKISLEKSDRVLDENVYI